MPSHRGNLSGGGSDLDRPRRASTIRHGPYHGLIQYQRFPNTPCTSVSPTQSSVQTVRGSGLESGSRLPRKPAATRVAKTAKEARLSGSRSASLSTPIFNLRADSRSSRSGRINSSTRKLAATAIAPPTR